MYHSAKLNSIPSVDETEPIYETISCCSSRSPSITFSPPSISANSSASSSPPPLRPRTFTRYATVSDSSRSTIDSSIDASNEFYNCYNFIHKNNVDEMDSVVVKLRSRQPLERFQSLQQQQQQRAAQLQKHPQRFDRRYSMINETLRLAESSQTTSPCRYCCSSSSTTDCSNKNNTFENVPVAQQQQISSSEKAGSAGRNSVLAAAAHSSSLATDHFHSNNNSSGMPTVKHRYNRNSLIPVRQTTPLNARKSLCLTELRWNGDDPIQRPLEPSASAFSGIFFAHPVTSFDGNESPVPCGNLEARAQPSAREFNLESTPTAAAVIVGTADRSVCSNDSGYLSSGSAKPKRFHRHNFDYVRGNSVPRLQVPTANDIDGEPEISATHGDKVRALSTCLTTQAEEAIYINTTSKTASSSTSSKALPTSTTATHFKAISCYNLSSAAADAAGGNVTRATVVHDQLPVFSAPLHDVVQLPPPPPAAINQVQLNEKSSSRPSLRHFSSSNDIVSSCNNITQRSLSTNAAAAEEVGENNVKPETSSTTTLTDNDNDRHCNIITCDRRHQCTLSNCSEKHSNLSAEDLHCTPPSCPPKKRLFLHSKPVPFNLTAATVTKSIPPALQEETCTSSFPSGPTTCNNCCQACAQFHSCRPITRSNEQQPPPPEQSQHKKFNANNDSAHLHERDLSHLTDSALSSSSLTTTTSNSFMSSTNSAAVAATVAPDHTNEEEVASKKEHALFLKFLRKRNIACTFLLPTANKTKNSNNNSSRSTDEQQTTLTTRPDSNFHKSHKSSSKTNFFDDVAEEPERLLQSANGTLVCGDEEAGESGDDDGTVIVQRTSLSVEFEQKQHRMLRELDDHITRDTDEEQHDKLEHREVVWQRHDEDEFHQTEPANLSDSIKPTSKPKIPRKPTFLRLRAQQQQQSSSSTASPSDSSDSQTPTTTLSANHLATQLLDSTKLIAVDIHLDDNKSTNHHEEAEEGGDDEQEEFAIHSDDMMDYPQACGLPPANMAQKFRLRLTERDMNRPLSSQQQQQQLGPGQTMHSFEKHTTWSTTKIVDRGNGEPATATSARSFSSSSSSSSPIGDEPRQQHVMRPSPLTTITKMPITHYPRSNSIHNGLDSSHQYVNTPNGTHHSSVFPTTPTSISNETYGRVVANNNNTRHFHHHSRQDTDTSDDLPTAAAGRYVKYKAYDSRELADAVAPTATVVKPIVIYRDPLPLKPVADTSVDADCEDDDGADDEQQRPEDGNGEPVILERSSSKRGSKMGRSLRDSMRLKARRSNVTVNGSSDADSNVAAISVPSAHDNDESLSSSTDICESVVGSSSSQLQQPHITKPIILARNHYGKQHQYQNTANNRASSTFFGSALPLYRPYTSSSPAVRPYSTALSGSSMSLSSAAITRVAPVAAAAKPVPPPPLVERQFSANTADPAGSISTNHRTQRAHSHHNIHQQQQHRVQFADMPQIIYAGETRRDVITAKNENNAVARANNNPVINQRDSIQNANQVSSSTTFGAQHVDVDSTSSPPEAENTGASSSDRLVVAAESPSTSRSSSRTDEHQPVIPLTRRTTAGVESVPAAADTAPPAVPIKRRPKDFNNTNGFNPHHAVVNNNVNSGMRIRNSQSWMSALHAGGGDSSANDAVRSVFDSSSSRNAVTPGATTGQPLLTAVDEEQQHGGLRNHQQRLYASVTSIPAAAAADNSNSNEPLAAALRAFTPDDLLKTKEHLVERIETKLVVLKEEQTLLNEDITATDRQLVQYAERIKQQANNSTTFAGSSNVSDYQQSHTNNNGQRLYEKFLDYVNEKERVTRLLLAIAARMVRSHHQQQQYGREAEVTPSSSEAEKSFGSGASESLRNNSVQQRVLGQQRDAQALKQRVDERGAVLMRTLAADALSAPEMYELHKLLTLRSQLLTDAHDLRVKIVNADEQLTNLKLLSHPTSGVVNPHHTLNGSGSAQPPSSSGVDRRSMFGSVSSLLSMPSSSSPSLLLTTTGTTPQPSSGGGIVHSKTPSSASSNGTLDSLESNRSNGDKSKYARNTSSSDSNGFEDNNKHLRQASNASSWGGQSTTFSTSTDV